MVEVGDEGQVVARLAREVKRVTLGVGRNAARGPSPSYASIGKPGVGKSHGLAAVGYKEADIPALVEGTLPQHRVTKLSPVSAGREDLAALFRASLRIW